MLKKLILALVAIIPFSAVAQKFAVVNLDKVLESMPEVAAMQQTLTEASKKYEDEFQKLQESIQKLYTDYQAIQDDPNTPQTIKDRRVQEIQEAAQKGEQFRTTATQDLQRQQQQLMAPIEDRMNKAIEAVGREGGFTIVFPLEPSLILYQGVDVVDITDIVIAKLAATATTTTTN